MKHSNWEFPNSTSELDLSHTHTHFQDSTSDQNLPVQVPDSNEHGKSSTSDSDSQKECATRAKNFNFKLSLENPNCNVSHCLESQVPSRRAMADMLRANFDSVISTAHLPFEAVQATFKWSLVHCRNGLPHALSNCPGFKHRFLEALAARPSSAASPWRLILYIDEITPGNVIRPDNKRKITAFYYSFCELGDFLRNEEAWLLAGVLRSDVVKNISGGIIPSSCPLGSAA